MHEAVEVWIGRRRPSCFHLVRQSGKGCRGHLVDPRAALLLQLHHRGGDLCALRPRKTEDWQVAVGETA